MMKGIKIMSKNENDKLVELLEVLKTRMIEWQGHVEEIIQAVKQ